MRMAKDDLSGGFCSGISKTVFDPLSDDSDPRTYFCPVRGWPCWTNQQPVLVGTPDGRSIIGESYLWIYSGFVRQRGICFDLHYDERISNTVQRLSVFK